MHNVFADHYNSFIIIENFVKNTNTIKSLNYYKMLKLSNKLNWTEIFTEKNVNEATERIINNVTYLIEKSYQYKKINHKKIPRNIWITKELIKASNKKECLYKG